VWASAGLDVAILGAIFTFVVGGLLIALGRSYTERTTKRALREPGWSFLVGLTAFICLVGLLILAALTVIFLIPAFPALLLFIPVSIVGSAIGYLLVGRALTDEWAVALVIATFIGAVAAGVPVLGGLIGFVLGSIGTGAVINEFRDPDSPQNSKLSPKVRRRR
jgi:MFS family permease